LKIWQAVLNDFFIMNSEDVLLWQSPGLGFCFC